MSPDNLKNIEARNNQLWSNRATNEGWTDRISNQNGEVDLDKPHYQEVKATDHKTGTHVEPSEGWETPSDEKTEIIDRKRVETAGNPSYQM